MQEEPCIDLEVAVGQEGPPVHHRSVRVCQDLFPHVLNNARLAHPSHKIRHRERTHISAMQDHGSHLRRFPAPVACKHHHQSHDEPQIFAKSPLEVETPSILVWVRQNDTVPWLLSERTPHSESYAIADLALVYANAVQYLCCSGQDLRSGNSLNIQSVKLCHFVLGAETPRYWATIPKRHRKRQSGWLTVSLT